MADRYRIENIGAALEARAFPTVTMWNRLEGRPRTADFVRSLRAAELAEGILDIGKNRAGGETSRP